MAYIAAMRKSITIPWVLPFLRGWFRFDINLLPICSQPRINLHICGHSVCTRAESNLHSIRKGIVVESSRFGINLHSISYPPVLRPLFSMSPKKCTIIYTSNLIKVLEFRSDILFQIVSHKSSEIQVRYFSSRLYTFSFSSRSNVLRQSHCLVHHNLRQPLTLLKAELPFSCGT